MTTNNSLTRFEHILVFIALALATFMMVLDYAIANVSIPYIAGDLAVSNDQGTYVITSFAVGNAIGLAMTGWLTKKVGENRLIIISIALFTLFSWACGLSINLNMLVISRFIQGLVSGPIIPLGQSLIIKHGTLETRTRDLSIWSTIVITAPVLGPILGGYISYWYVWSWIFYINIPVGIFCVITLYAILWKRPQTTEKAPNDITGMILLAIGVSCLQILLDKGQQWDWQNSERIWMLSIGSIIAFTLLIIWELGHDYPFLNLRLFSIPSFSLSIICLAVSYGTYFGTIVLIPLWLQEYMGYTAEWAGFAVAPLGIGPILFSLITPKIMQKLGNVRTLLISFFIFGIGSLCNVFFTTDVDIFHIALVRFIFGFGFVFYMNPLISMSIQHIREDSLPAATGIFHFVRSMVGGIGTSLFTTLWARRTIFHHERVGSSLTPFNPMTPQATDKSSLMQLNNSLDLQASMLALNDAFYIMTWLFAGLIVLLLGWYFFRSRKLQKQPEANLSTSMSSE